MSYLLTLNDQNRLSQSLKKSVRAATVGVNLNLALSLATLDSASLSVGDRILVKDQSTPSQNGIYEVIAGNFLQRSDDAITGKVYEGMLVAVGAGTTNAASIWMVTTDNPITVGVTSLTFTQAGGGGGGNSTSIYAKTVFVSKGHERATDTRVGLDLFDMENPFETLQAANDEIVAALETEVSIYVADGYYDEIVTLGDYIDIKGMGSKVFITRIVANSGTVNRISDVILYSDAATPSAAPNESLLEISNGTAVYLSRVLAEDLYLNSDAVDRGAVTVNGGSLNAHACRFGLIALHGGASTVAYGGIHTTGSNLNTLYLQDCDCYASSNAAAQKLYGILHEGTNAANSILSLGGGSLSGAFTGVAAGPTGIAAGFGAIGASQGNVDLRGISAYPQFNSGGTGTITPVIVNSSGTVEVTFSSPTFVLTQTPTGAGSCEQATNTLRLLDVVWADFPTGSVPPARIGATLGTYVHTGTLANGSKFPNSSTYSKNIYVAKNHERATDTRTGLTKYDINNPFSTIQAAVNAVDTTDTNIFISAETYNESVTLAAFDINLIGDGESTLISKVICNQNQSYTFRNLKIENTGSTVNPNTRALEISGSSKVILDNCIISNNRNAVGTGQSPINISGASSTLSVVNGSTINFQGSFAGTGAGFYSLVEIVEDCSSVILKDSTLTLAINSSTVADNFCAVYGTDVGSANNIIIDDCQVKVQCLNNSSTGKLSFIASDTAGGVRNIKPSNNYVVLESLAGANVVILYSLLDAVTVLLASNNTVLFNTVVIDNYISEDNSGSIQINIAEEHYLDPQNSVPQRFSSTTSLFNHSGTVKGIRFPITSNYFKTVWVSSGHERASDTRTGLSMFDQEHPYQSINGACLDITAAVETNVLIFAEAGTYNEVVTMPDQCTLMGRGDRTVITQVVIPASFECTLKDITLLSTPAKIAPNESALILNDLSYTQLDNVKISTELDSELVDLSTIKINGGILVAKNSTFSFDGGGANAAAEFFSCIRRATASDNEITLESCMLTASTGTQDQEIAAIVIKDTDVIGGGIELNNCKIKVFQNDGASTCVVSAICHDDTDGVDSVRLNNCSIQINTSSGNVDAPIFVARATNGVSFHVTDTIISVLGPSPNNIYISEDDDAATSLRFTGITHIDTPNILGRFNTPTATTFIYEGILSTGIRFPQLKILEIAGKNEVDGLTTTLLTEEFVSLAPLIYGEGTTFRFCAILTMSDVALTGTAYLQNITEPGTELVTDSTLTATGAGSDSPTVYRSNPLTVGSNAGDLKDVATMYEVRITNDGTLGTEITKLSKAWLEIGV